MWISINKQLPEKKQMIDIFIKDTAQIFYETIFENGLFWRFRKGAYGWPIDKNEVKSWRLSDDPESVLKFRNGVRYEVDLTRAQFDLLLWCGGAHSKSNSNYWKESKGAKKIINKLRLSGLVIDIKSTDDVNYWTCTDKGFALIKLLNSEIKKGEKI